MNMEFERKLPIPKEVKELYPLSDDLKKIVETRKADIRVCFISPIQTKNPICIRELLL